MKKLAIIVLLLVAGPLFSQTAFVRGGDHDRFTRLVVSVDHADRWEFRQNGRKATVSLNNSAVRIQTGDVFSRIRRSRVSSVVARGDVLSIDLACDCVISAKSMGPNLIVLDVRRGKMPVQPPIDGQIIAMKRRAPLPMVADPQPPSIEDVSVSLALTQSPSVFRSGPPSRLAGVSSFSRYIVDQRGSGTSGRLQAMEDRLVKQLGLAATQGLLDANTSPMRQLGTAAEPDQQSNESLADLQSALSVTASRFAETKAYSDPGSSIENASHQDATAALECGAAAAFDVPAWGEVDKFSEMLSEIRSQLYGEFDKPNPEAWLKLARLYAFHGMGAEARQAAAQANAEKSDQHAVDVIAHVLDFGDKPYRLSVTPLVYCESMAALWGLLASQDIGELPESRVKKIVEMFSVLPPHLIDTLSPLLSRKLQMLGHSDLAGVALRLSLWSGETSQSQNLQNIRLSEESASAADLTADLRKLLETNSPEAPIALAEYVELTIASGGHVSEDIILLAETYSIQYRDSPISPVVDKSYILALASAGRFFESFAQVRQSRGASARLHEIENELYQLVTKYADDVTFIYFFSGGGIAMHDHLNQDVAFPAAERLLQLGFLSLAIDLVLQYPPDLLSEDENEILARLSLDDRSREVVFESNQEVSNKFANSLENQRNGIVSTKMSANENEGPLILAPHSGDPTEVLQPELNSSLESTQNISLPEITVSSAQKLLTDTIELRNQVRDILVSNN